MGLILNPFTIHQKGKIIEIYTASALQGLTIEKADLRYFKKGVVCINNDDSLSFVYKMLLPQFVGGRITWHWDAYADRGGWKNPDGSYYGTSMIPEPLCNPKCYTDGFGNNIPFGACSGLFTGQTEYGILNGIYNETYKTPGVIATHKKNNEDNMWTSRINTLIDNGFDICSHQDGGNDGTLAGAQSSWTALLSATNTYFMNRDNVKRPPLFYYAGGGNSSWGIAGFMDWFDNSLAPYLNYRYYGHDGVKDIRPNNLSAWNPYTGYYKFGRTFLGHSTMWENPYPNPGLKTEIDAMMAQTSGAWILRIGFHSIRPTDFYPPSDTTRDMMWDLWDQYVNYLETAYGRYGTDTLMVAPVTHVVQYLYTKFGTTISQSSIDNKVRLTFDTSAIPSYITKRGLTFKATSPSQILGISGFNGMKYKLQNNNREAIIDVEL